MREYDAYIFDLDGTLLDTLADLVFLTNKVLDQAGFPVRTGDEIHSFVGNGLRSLMVRAAPSGTSDEVIDHLLSKWKDLYPEYGVTFTQPYPHIIELLTGLRESDKKLAVLSNKFDGGTKDIIEQFFPGVFLAVHGEGPGIPRKPDPTGLKKTLSEIGVSAESAVYVGDSPNDIVTAHAAGTDGIAVSWGYHKRSELVKCGITCIVDDALEILP